MAVPTRTEFLARFPEFAELSTSVVDSALAEAGRATPTATWGSVHTEAVAYFTAHLLATRVMQIGTQVGTVSGAPVGQKLETTLYGQAYQRLLDSLPLTGFSL